MSKDEQSIGRCISILYRYGQCYVGKKLEELNIGSGQYGILLALYRQGGISQEDLAGQLKTDKGSIAKSIKKLENEGYVERKDDARDKRAYKVFLTAKGSGVIPVVEQAIESWENTITAPLSAEEKQTIVRLLRAMADKAHCNRNQE